MSEKTNPVTLINQIFEFALENNEEKKHLLLQELIPSMMDTTNKFFLVAASDTTQQDWENKEFAVFVSDSKDLLVFLDREDAYRFAMQNKLVASQTPMVICLSYDALVQLVISYVKRGLITQTKIFARRPLFLFCPIDYFEKHQKQKPIDLMSHSFTPDEKIVYPAIHFKMVDDVKNVLDQAEISKRRAIDPGLICENLHAVIEKLIYFNKLDMSEIESQLKLPSGMLQKFCADRVSCSISKSTTIKLLSYFGLQEYLYQYKRYCGELMTELSQDDTIDVYEIKLSNIRTKEKFKLIKIRRGHDQRNNAYIYELTLRSKQRTIPLIVSTPLNYVVGKSYEIIGLDAKDKTDDTIPCDKAKEKKSGHIRHSSKIPQNKVSCALNAVGPIEKDSPSKGSHGNTPDQSQKDYQTIISYFKETDGDNYAAADAKFRELEQHADVVHAFANYIRTKRPGRLKVAEYTPGQLMNSLHYTPFEAYKIIIALRESPKETKQMLIYRQTDPQYQTK